jgi:hypothetical protein
MVVLTGSLLWGGASASSSNAEMRACGFMMIVPIYAKVSNNKSSLPRY